MNTFIHKLSKAYVQVFRTHPENYQQLPGSGSARTYIRFSHPEYKVLGVYHPCVEENKAFINYTHQLRNLHVPVPKVWEIPGEEYYYFVEDLGTETLLTWLERERTQGTWPAEATERYKKVITELAHAQIVAGASFDYSFAHPVAHFNRQSMRWDLDYFKYYFVKRAGVKFNEYQLEVSFTHLLERISSVDAEHFMFRDFQARNILFANDTPWFIDYQGGRKGPLQYDLVSLLYQAKARIPEAVRHQLILHYLKEASQYTSLNQEAFVNDLYPIALLRNLQTLGAYGLRGSIEKKSHFIESIPQAVENTEKLILLSGLQEDLSEIVKIIEQVNPENFMTHE
jgi:aminoglycoside/choline kinase family phosphotransferase